MVACGWIMCLFQHDSPKLSSFQNIACGTVKIILYIVVVACICYMFIVHKRHQEKEELTSAVRINLKGVVYAGRIWDSAEYTMPMQSRDSFFVMTNVIETKNQFQKTCPEYPIDKAICSSDKSCEEGIAHVHGNERLRYVTTCQTEGNDFTPLVQTVTSSVDPRVQTGRCVHYNATYKTCEIKAWCPVQEEKAPPEPAVLRNSEDFTVLIKNNIHFPTFNYTAQNISPKLNISCKFNKVTSPLCPIFRLGDIVKEAKENYSEMAIKGGIIAIEIKWDCNLDSWFHHCSPEYSFRRLDDKTRTHYTGFNFRFANHYKLPDGREHRTLFKAYGIRFDVLVFGMAGKFSFTELFIFLGSTITYLGLAGTIIETGFCLYKCFNCCKIAFCEKVIRKKYEAVPMPEVVMFVSHVDEPQITLVKMPLKTSLQNAESSIAENCFVKFYDPRTCESSENHSTGECELRELTQSTSSSACPKWCNCGRCNESENYQEQLCCRKTDGQCVTTSRWFMQLVLSRDTLNNALLYDDPFLDQTGHESNSRLRRVAYKQYIHWRFGFSDLEDRAIIPSCCKNLIRNTYPN